MFSLIVRVLPALGMLINLIGAQYQFVGNASTTEASSKIESTLRPDVPRPPEPIMHHPPVPPNHFLPGKVSLFGATIKGREIVRNDVIAFQYLKGRSFITEATASLTCTIIHILAILWRIRSIIQLDHLPSSSSSLVSSVCSCCSLWFRTRSLLWRGETCWRTCCLPGGRGSSTLLMVIILW